MACSYLTLFSAKESLDTYKSKIYNDDVSGDTTSLQLYTNNHRNAGNRLVVIVGAH
jgi:hypothetical protein